MRTTVLILVGIILILIGTGCKKEKDEWKTLKCNSIAEGGCFLEKGSSYKGDSPSIDTLFSRMNFDSLAIGYYDNCCSEFSCSVSIKNNLITVNILTTKIGTCDCVCYYTYIFKFTGSGEPTTYYIKVFIDDKLRLETYFNFPFQ